MSPIVPPRDAGDPDADLPVLHRVLKPGRVPAPARSAPRPLGQTSEAAVFRGRAAGTLKAAADAPDHGSAAGPAAAAAALIPAGATLNTTAGPAAGSPAPEAAVAATLAALPAAEVLPELPTETRRALEERIRQAVLDDIQFRLDEVIRDTLDRSLEPLLNEAVASVRQELQDSLHGIVADSLGRAFAGPPAPSEAATGRD